MLPRPVPASLAALVVGPICALLVVTSVFRPMAPDGNLRWGFWALTPVFALASLGFLRARTMRQAALRGAAFSVFFAVVGCAFVWWSEPASRLDGVRVYGLGGHVFTGACIVVCTTAILVAVAWPILGPRNERAHDHGEGFVTALATLTIPFVAFVMMDRSMGARRVDAVLGALALPCLALVIVLVVRARRFALWRRAEKGAGDLGIVEARGDEEAVLPLLRAFPGDRCIVHTSMGGNGGYREGGVRIPLARVPATMPSWAPIRMALPVLVLVFASLALLATRAPSRPLFMPRVVSEYAGGRTEVFPSWYVDDVGGLVLWQVRMGSYPDEKEALVAVDEHGALVEGAALFTRLAAAGVKDETLADVARLTLLRTYPAYIPNLWPCEHAENERFERRERGDFLFCLAQREPTPEAPQGQRLLRYRAALGTGALTLEAHTWRRTDGSVPELKPTDP